MNSAPVLEQKSLVVALCGPSGAGKSFLTKAILEAYPSQFFIPRVCTTRQPRGNTAELNRRFLSEDEYREEVSQKKIVLDHQPFSEHDSPRYGFLNEDLIGSGGLLTEVHPTIIEPFVSYFENSPRLLIGVELPFTELVENLRKRDVSVENSDDFFDLRVKKMREEASMIRDAHSQGLIDELVTYTAQERETTERKILGKLAILINNNEPR